VGRDVSKTGTTAAPFLEIPVGARAMAMGGAFAGTANDASCLFWNVSGLARLPRSEAMFTHMDWLADLKFDYAALTVPMGDFGSLGVSFTSLSMPDMAVTTIDYPQGNGEVFSAGSFAVAVHYARNLSERFSIGFTGKFIQERIWNERATGFAIDAGTLFTADVLGGLRIGASISNFGTNMQLSGRDTRTFIRVDPTKTGSNSQIPTSLELDTWRLPLNFQFGLAADIIATDDHLLTVAVDALHPGDNYESVNVGGEYGFLKTFFLRGGYQALGLADSEGGLCLGAGVQADLFGSGMQARFDYAYSDYGRLKSVNVFAVALIF
jgi:hypothetical protein